MMRHATQETSAGRGELGGSTRAALSLAFAMLFAALAACDDEAPAGPADADADAAPDAAADIVDVQADPEPDPEPDPLVDVAPDPVAEPDVEPDAPEDVEVDEADTVDAVDVADEEIVEVPEFQLFYSANLELPVGLTDPMGLALAGDRLYATGLWQDSARVSYFELATPSAPWCLYDELGWPTGVAEEPVSGDILVADMVFGLAVVTPPDNAGDCGCDPGIETACEAWWWWPDDADGIGGVTAADDGTVYLSGIVDAVRIDETRLAGERAIWEVDLNDGTPIATIIASGTAVGDAVGLHTNGAGSLLYVADSDGLLRLFFKSGDAWTLASAPLQRGYTGFPAGVGADDTNYYWAIQSPFAYPGTSEGGSVLRVSLDGLTVDELGAGSLIWPAGLTSDGTQWYVADRATGIWGFF